MIIRHLTAQPLAQPAQTFSTSSSLAAYLRLYISHRLRSTNQYTTSAMAYQAKMPADKQQAASQHVAADYSSLQASDVNLPPWKKIQSISATQTSNPHWNYGEGTSTTNGSEVSHVEIDPFAAGRPMFHNYTLLVSGIVPRPVGFLSTVGKDGSENLSPFSYFQVVDHDPPVFVLGFSGRPDRPKDTLRNLEETGEVVINTVSEHFIEAVNATSLDAPYEASEWAISGLTKAPSSTVKPSRVKESIFSIEGKLIEIVDYKSTRTPTGAHGHLAIIEATRFWAREDALDEKHSKIDLEVLRPVGQLGGVSYARITDTFELPRSNWKKATASDGPLLDKLLKGEGSNDA